MFREFIELGSEFTEESYALLVGTLLDNFLDDVVSEDVFGELETGALDFIEDQFFLIWPTMFEYFLDLSGEELIPT